MTSVVSSLLVGDLSRVSARSQIAAEDGVFILEEGELPRGTLGMPALAARLVALALGAFELVLDILKVPSDRELAPDADEICPGSPKDDTHARTVGIEEQ